jgi:hypothetical protein
MLCKVPDSTGPNRATEGMMEYRALTLMLWNVDERYRQLAPDPGTLILRTTHVGNK